MLMERRFRTTQYAAQMADIEALLRKRGIE